MSNRSFLKCRVESDPRPVPIRIHRRADLSTSASTQARFGFSRALAITHLTTRLGDELPVRTAPYTSDVPID